MSKDSTLTIVATGVANLASVQALATRLGMKPVITDRPKQIETASYVIVPGVGSFGPAMEALRSTGSDCAIRSRVLKGLPTMGICLGMQLFFEESEESPGVQGLGIIHGAVRKLANNLPLPQLGWNRIKPSSSCRILNSSWAYFANSYAASPNTPATSSDGSIALTPAIARYESPFLAALEGWNNDRLILLLCQFHPELSGPWGTELVRRWLEGGNL